MDPYEKVYILSTPVLLQEKNCKEREGHENDRKRFAKCKISKNLKSQSAQDIKKKNPSCKDEMQPPSGSDSIRLRT